MSMFLLYLPATKDGGSWHIQPGKDTLTNERSHMCIIAEDTLLDYAFLEALCTRVIIHCYVKHIKPNKKVFMLYAMIYFVKLYL